MKIQKRDMQAAEKIIGFLLDHSGDDFYLSQIAKASKTSISTCHEILEKEVRGGFVKKSKLGNLSFYAADLNDPLVCQQKVLRTIRLLKPLVLKLKVFSKKIILFGSTAEGTDRTDSDIDLLVLSNNALEVRKIVSKFLIRKRLQLVIKSFLEWVEFQEKDKIFYEEIKKGKVLWEENETK